MAKPRSNQKKEEIFQAALMLFSQNGFTKTTIKDIAKEAGVSFGTVFTYYESKEVLFYECVNRPLKEFKELIEETRKEASELTLFTLKDLIKGHVDLFLSMEKELRIIQYVIGQYERFSELKVLDEFVDYFLDYIQEVVEVGMEKGFLTISNPREIGYGYLAFLNGARLTYSDEANVMLTNTFTNMAYRIFGIEGDK